MPDNSAPMERARSVVLEWIRTREGDPRPPSTLASGYNGHSHHGEIANLFLQWARRSGFDYQLVEVPSRGGTAYETLWTHRGSSFVGFKQPPPQDSAEDALLLGCAALLENEWCRQRLSSRGAKRSEDLD